MSFYYLFPETFREGLEVTMGIFGIYLDYDLIIPLKPIVCYGCLRKVVAIVWQSSLWEGEALFPPLESGKMWFLGPKGIVECLHRGVMLGNSPRQVSKSTPSLGFSIGGKLAALFGGPRVPGSRDQCQHCVKPPAISQHWLPATRLSYLKSLCGWGLRRHHKRHPIRIVQSPQISGP